MLMAITSKDDPLQPDLLYLNGNIEIMVDDELIVVGPFEGALLLLPSLEVLALGVLRLRDLHSRVEFILVGDTPSLWLIGKPPPRSETVEIHYRQQKTRPVLRTEFDAACERAVAEFLSWLEAQRPVSTWSSETKHMRQMLVTTWPSLA
jgi:hypothetical protein